MRLAIIAIASTLICGVALAGPIAELDWDYSVDPNALADGFSIYRGSGALCDTSAPLADKVVDNIAVEIHTYVDNTVPVETGPLCYEITAFNSAGESEHSNRAVALTESLIPKIPQGVVITASE